MKRGVFDNFAVHQSSCNCAQFIHETLYVGRETRLGVDELLRCSCAFLPLSFQNGFFAMVPEERLSDAVLVEPDSGKCRRTVPLNFMLRDFTGRPVGLFTPSCGHKP